MIFLLRRISMIMILCAMLIIPWMSGGALIGEYLAYANWGIFAGFFLFCLSMCGDLSRFDLKPVAHWPWLLPFVAVSGWIAVQLFVVPKLVGSVYGIETFVSPFDEQITISPGPVSWYESIDYWARFATYWAVAYFVFCLTAKEGRWLFFMLVFAGLFQLFYGVFFSREAGVILGIWEKVRHVGSITGTYGHPNHFTGYMSMMMPVVIAGIMFFFYTNNAKKLKQIGLLAGCLLLVVFSALIILGSAVRLSMAACVVGWLVFFWLVFKHKFKLNFWWRLGLVFGVGGSALLIYVAKNLAFIQYQVERLGVVEGRFGVWENILRLPDFVWLWGAGAGVFGDIYVLVSTPVLSNTRPYEEAHNDYLQFLLEFGFIGTALVLIAGFFWLYKLRPTQMSWMKIGAIAGIAAMLVRLGADFDLQLPGTAVYFWALCGLLLNPNFIDRSKKRKRRRSSSKTFDAMADVYEDPPSSNQYSHR